MSVQDLHEEFEFRGIDPADPGEADEAVEIEQICFPPHEACSEKDMKSRIKAAPELFLAAIHRKTGRMAGFLTGIATDERAFRDVFFTDVGTHKPEGKNIMLLGLDVRPEYRSRGLGRELVSVYSKMARARGKQRLVLTCSDDKVGMYTGFGFRDLGISASEWGGESWHEMEKNL